MSSDHYYINLEAVKPGDILGYRPGPDRQINFIMLISPPRPVKAGPASEFFIRDIEEPTYSSWLRNRVFIELNLSDSFLVLLNRKLLQPNLDHLLLHQQYGLLICLFRDKICEFKYSLRAPSYAYPFILLNKRSD